MRQRIYNDHAEDDILFQTAKEHLDDSSEEEE
jgi:hypothetical protein